MKFTQVITYGGSYREEWDDNYKLTVEYDGTEDLRMDFSEGTWKPERQLPALPLAESFFPQAASAAVAARRFLASGMTAKNLSVLAPDSCSGPVFAAECLRILMDDDGLPLELIYPYIATCFENQLNEQELQSLHVLQPRTAHLVALIWDLIGRVSPVLHDLRLPEYRTPFGAVESGTEVRLAVDAPEHAYSAAVLELYGDSLYREMPMQYLAGQWELSFTAPETPAALWYRFRLQQEEQNAWLCCAADGIHSILRDEAQEGFRLTVYQAGFQTPDWFRHSVLYQIFPDRFAFSSDDTAVNGVRYHRELGQNAELHLSLYEELRWKPRLFEADYIPDDFYGGTLQGIREKIPYLKSLGISCIYLNPIFESRSNHRYDTSDYLKIDPILGTNEDFAALCQDAGENGIKIICDGVFSHTGADSIYFNRDGHYPAAGACQWEASPYDSWYDFQHFPDQYRSWWGFRELPEVNERDPAWQEFVVSGQRSVVRQWLRLGASGWRLDVADELPDDVLELIRSAVKEENPENLVLGEVWEDAVLKESYGSRRRYALGTALDSVMNYPFRGAILDFLHQRCTAFSLADFLTSQQLHYPKPLYFSLMNLLGSHDVERLLTALATPVRLKELSREEQLAEEAKLSEEDWQRAERLEKLALAIQFSIPGVPSVYYGDEFAMSGTNDPFNRRPLLWEEHTEDGVLRAFIQSLSQMRTSHPTMVDGDAFFFAINDDVLLILRTLDETILTVVNRGDQACHYEVFLPGCKTSGEIGPCCAETRFLEQET